MSYNFDATDDFFSKVVEVERLLTLSAEEEEGQNQDRQLFMKLSIVTLVTKFQVFAEAVMEEYIYTIKNRGLKSRKIPLHCRMNSLYTEMVADNVFEKVIKQRDFSEERREKIKEFISSICYITDENAAICETLRFDTKFPLGKTGKNELIKLLKQIDGNQDPFGESLSDGSVLDMGKFDALLQTRHLIVHQDRFSGTDEKVNEYLLFCKTLVGYIDIYLSQRLFHN